MKCTNTDCKQLKHELELLEDKHERVIQAAYAAITHVHTQTHRGREVEAMRWLRNAAAGHVNWRLNSEHSRKHKPERRSQTTVTRHRRSVEGAC